tara:strand:+ start:339 stop:887 length:549 start_codon:yes stop_codon:yes gene_type:complete
MNQVNLDKFDNGWYKPASKLKNWFWYFTNLLFFKTTFPFPSTIKVKILKAFGSTVGNAVVIKPNVNIKYPWFLTVGDNCWVGENVWIDNLALVTIGNNVCLSQGTYLVTGSHDYKKEAFDLLLGEIVLEDGVWIGANATVCPNVVCKSHSVLAVGSIATQNLNDYGIYQGNPARFKRKRDMI